MSNSKIILYASYQTGENLPGYIQFALKHLAETDFTVVLLTNRRPLSAETMAFLEDNKIQLYLTENHGLDFGMWRRFLKDLANGHWGFASLDRITRILLINDSVVYFQNHFTGFIQRAENSSADAVSLTESDDVRPHLQSFFLYLKQEALGAFYLHLLETPEQDSNDMPHRVEISMANAFDEAEVQTAALYRTHLQSLSAYPELIAQGAGFIKCRLLRRNYSIKEKIQFLRQGAYDTLNANYQKLVMDAGLAKDFKEEWLPGPGSNSAVQLADRLWQKAFHKLSKFMHK